MTDETNPIEALFQLQRDTIEQTEDVAEGFLAAPSEVGETLGQGVETQRDVQEQALELSRQSIHRSLDAAGRVAPEHDQLDELREAIDEAFEELAAQQAEAFDAVEASADSVSEEVVENLGDQIDLLIEVNERIEAQLREAVEQLPAEVADGDELTEDLERLLQDLTTQFERQRERLGELDAGRDE